MKLPSLSPNTKIVQDFSTSSIEITYSRPSARGRNVFGDLVPYNKIWRTGANAVSKIKLNEALSIGGQHIAEGEYALYTIPGEQSWEVIINTGTGNWGVGGYSSEGDVARFTVTPAITDNRSEVFTIDVTDITYTTCSIVLLWDNVKVSIPVVADNDERIDTHVATMTDDSTKPHYQIATYYFEKKDAEKASAAIDKALELQPGAFYMWHLKARIEQRLGNKETAAAAANRSIELAKGTAYEEAFAVQNGKLLAELN